MNIYFMSKILKQLKSIEAEVGAFPKYYSNHLWITPPADDGFSYIGLSEFAKRYFVRFNKINIDRFSKTNYSIQNRFHIEAFCNQTKQRREKGELKTAEKIQWNRFLIKKDEPFAILQAIEFDIELNAPVDLRVVQIEDSVYWSNKILSPAYIFRAEVFNPLQINELMNEKQYQQSPKMFKLP